MSRYDPIFSAYVAELRIARAVAMTWWDELLARASPDPSAAQAAVRPRWPAGAVSHPRVIAVYRKYHLICERMNIAILDGSGDPDRDLGRPDGDDADWGTGQLEDEGVEEPYFTLVERTQITDKALGDFIAGLLFVPVGTDDNGDPA